MVGSVEVDCFFHHQEGDYSRRHFRHPLEGAVVFGAEDCSYHLHRRRRLVQEVDCFYRLHRRREHGEEVDYSFHRRHLRADRGSIVQNQLRCRHRPLALHLRQVT